MDGLPVAAIKAHMDLTYSFHLLSYIIPTLSRLPRVNK